MAAVGEAGAWAGDVPAAPRLPAAARACDTGPSGASGVWGRSVSRSRGSTEVKATLICCPLSQLSAVTRVVRGQPLPSLRVTATVSYPPAPRAGSHSLQGRPAGGGARRGAAGRAACGQGTALVTPGHEPTRLSPIGCWQLEGLRPSARAQVASHEGTGGAGHPRTCSSGFQPSRRTNLTPRGAGSPFSTEWVSFEKPRE